MKKALPLLLLALACVLGSAQTTSTQYQHIGYSWTPGTLAVCSTTLTKSCVKDYVLNVTDPTGAAQPTITVAYSLSSYTYGPGGFLYCGTWNASLAIEYLDETGAAKISLPATVATVVSCPFVVSPPSGFIGPVKP